MLTMKHLLLFSCLPCFLQLAAQPHSDCASALLICDQQTIHVDTLYGSGNDKTELNEASCFLNGAPGNVEANSCWIRFAAAQSGSLFFTITPNMPDDDVDFVLFQLEDSSNCQPRQLLRCMAAGDYIGSGSPSPCGGPTGLLPGETDTLEDAGCTDPDDNNFLAPVDLLAGETYLLCVQNFTDLNGFSVEFFGTALLGCDTSNVLTATYTPLQPAYRLHRLYPNPVSAAAITLDMETEEATVMQFTLVNALGQPVRQVQRSIPAGRHGQEVPVENLPDGAYWLHITDGRASITRLIWIIN